MDTLVKSKVYIRWMIKRDMPEVLNIEKDNFKEFCWSENDFMVTLKQRSVIGMVAEVDDKVVGYMIYNLEPEKLELFNLAVHKEYQRQGIATQMVNKLKDKISYGTARRKKLTADVSELNLSAQLFFSQMGFFCWEEDPNYYEDEMDFGAYLFEYYYDNNN